MPCYDKFLAGEQFQCVLRGFVFADFYYLCEIRTASWHSWKVSERWAGIYSLTDAIKQLE